MNRKVSLFALLLVVGMSWMAVGQSIPVRGTQSVLLMVPAGFHDAELIYVLQQFVNKEADIYVAAMGAADSSDAAALQARIPDHFFNLMPNLSGGPHVTVLSTSESLAWTFDKVLILGGGWYDQYFASSGYASPSDPPYGEELYMFLHRAITENTVLCAVGAGVYPVIYSGVLPQGARVAAYPCSDLITAITEQGYQPLEAKKTPRPDGSGPPIVTIDIHVETSNGATIVMAPIPNSWYAQTQEYGDMLIDDYSEFYLETVSTVEEAYFTLAP